MVGVTLKSPDNTTGRLVFPAPGYYVEGLKASDAGAVGIEVRGGEAEFSTVLLDIDRCPAAQVYDRATNRVERQIAQESLHLNIRQLNV